MLKNLHITMYVLNGSFQGPGLGEGYFSYSDNAVLAAAFTSVLMSGFPAVLQESPLVTFLKASISLLHGAVPMLQSCMTFV